MLAENIYKVPYKVNENFTKKRDSVRAVNKRHQYVE